MNKKSTYIILILFFTFSIKSVSQSNYYLFYENQFSESVGAENLLTIHKAFYTLEEKYLPSSIIAKPQILNIGYRIAKSFMIDYPVDYLTILTQNEVFGHGARYRELNYTNNSYHLDLPAPFGKGNGIAFRGTGSISSLDENMTISFSGNEANTVLSDILRTKWVIDDSVHYRDFLVYAESYHNITAYIYRTQWKTEHNQISGGDDMNTYVNDINYKYFQQTGKKYSINDLAKYAIINLFDPYQFISFFHWGNYILTGKQKGKLYMLKIKDIQYLPSFNLALTPFGSEFYFNNYLKWNKYTFKIYARYGDPKFEKFWGAGTSVFNIIKNNYASLNASADIWEQPSLTLYNDNKTSRTTTKGYGACVSAMLGITLIKNKVNLIAYSGYKTDGFLQGENLSKGFFLRAGLGFVNL